MRQNWNDIKWIFKPDGSLRDIYVQEVTIDDWETLIDHLNDKWNLHYGFTNEKQINKKYVIERLKDKTGEKEMTSTRINLGGPTANCHFFSPDEIEFDILPNEILSIDDYMKVESFMKSISTSLCKQVTLTPENRPEYLFIKVGMPNNIVKVLSSTEAKQLFPRRNWLVNQLRCIRFKIMFKFFRRRLKEKLIDSASKPHISSKKSDNLW